MAKLSNELREAIGSLLKGFETIPLSNETYESQRSKATHEILLLLIKDALSLQSVNDDIIASIVKSDSAEQKDFMFTDKILSEILYRGRYGSYSFDRKTFGETREFGYRDMAISFAVAIEGIFGETVDHDSIVEAVEAGLHIKMRNLKADEYYKYGKHVEDMQFIIDISKSPKEYYQPMLDAIESMEGGDLSVLDGSTRDIIAIYNEVFRDGFGTKPYAGVFFDETGFITMQNNKAVKIRQAALKNKGFAQRVYSKIKDAVEISKQRQIDFDAINRSSKTVYFPYKIIEFAMGYAPTQQVDVCDYSSEVSYSTWDSYRDSYVKPCISEIMRKSVYYFLEVNSKYKSGFRGSDFTLTHADVDSCVDFIVSSLSSEERLYTNLEQYIEKVSNSLKCCYILTRWGFYSNALVDVGLRVTTGKGYDCFKCNTDDMANLFKNLFEKNDKELFFEPYDLSSGVTNNNKSLSANIYEYLYDVNPLLKRAEPLFGYVVQQQNQKRGVKSTWQRILIGESYAGKELYAQPKDKGSDIPLQEYFIHNIYAGSRSGKGVMTMNILAAAITDTGKDKDNPKLGKPIFYLDRKPDMGAVMYNMSRGNMFIVNGGLFNGDYGGYMFNPVDGEAMGYWRDCKDWLLANPSILRLFDTSGSGDWSSHFGDVIYLRAFMFVMGIFYVRCKLRSEDEKTYKEDFNGDDGIVLVLDELYGFQGAIGKIFSDVSSPLVQKAMHVHDIEKIKSLLENCSKEMEVIKLEIDKAYEKNNVAQAKKKELELDKLKQNYQNMKAVDTIYASTYYNKFIESWVSINDFLVAGFKDKEFLFSDIFVLGQLLDSPYHSSAGADKIQKPVFFQLTKDGSFYNSVNNADPIRSFLEHLNEGDWFLGRNPGIDIGDVNSSTMAKNVRDEDGNWEYLGKHTCDEIKNSVPVKHNCFFKPYLVLNDVYTVKQTVDENGKEVVKETISSAVEQCISRTNKTAGKEIWSDVAAKHSTNGRLNDGIGFEGLVFEAMKTTSPDLTTDSVRSRIEKSLSGSSEIANRVAKKMGYNCWQELIYDLSPMGLFSVEDMYKAFMSPEDYNPKYRLSAFYELGLLGNSEQSSSEEKSTGGETGGFNPNMSAFADKEHQTGSEYPTGSERDAKQEFDMPEMNMDEGVTQPLTQSSVQPASNVRENSEASSNKYGIDLADPELLAILYGDVRPSDEEFVTKTQDIIEDFETGSVTDEQASVVHDVERDIANGTSEDMIELTEDDYEYVAELIIQERYNEMGIKEPNLEAEAIFKPIILGLVKGRMGGE